MKISEILSSLDKEQYSQLMYAFENGFTQFIIYRPGRFIGVNVHNIGNLDLVNQEGVWCSGNIKEK